jgi:hypothetical protein
MSLSKAGSSAVSISAIEVTGSAVAYTVPAGKTAKVRVVQVHEFATAKYLYIGNYRIRNGSPVTVYSYNQSKGYSGNGNSMGLPVAGFVRASADYDELDITFVYIKEDHVLVAGETVHTNDTGAIFAYTIFEEDA